MVHRPGYPCRNTVQMVQAQYVRTSTSTHVYYARRPGCPCHILYHAHIHVLSTSGTTLGLHMPTTVHTHIHIQDTLLGFSKPKTVPRVHTRNMQRTSSSIRSDLTSRPGREYAAAQHHTENTRPCTGPVRVLYTRLPHSHAPMNTHVRLYVHCHRNPRAVRSQTD